MSEHKEKLHGRLQEKKRRGSEILTSILDNLNQIGALEENSLSTIVGIDKTILIKYVDHLMEKKFVEVKKRMLRDSIVSITDLGRAELASSKKNPQETEDPQPETVAQTPENKSSPQHDQQPLQTPTTPQKIEDSPQPSTTSIEKIVPETAQELEEVCKSLTSDFMGVMRLHGEMEDQSYTAALLVDKGDIIALSFEHMDTAEITYGASALGEIKSKFVGSKGDLEIFETDEETFNESLTKNVDLLLSPPIRLSSLNIKIRRRIRQPEEKSVLQAIGGMLSSPDSDFKNERRQMIDEKRKQKIGKIAGVINLIDFARQLTLDPIKAQRFDEIRVKKGEPKKSSEMDEMKKKRFEELKRQRAGAQKPLLNTLSLKSSQAETDKISQTPKIILEPSKQPVKTVKEGKKVKTKIDQLYELVESTGRVKINDLLSAKLKVSRTQIEAWAMILEEHELLELHYPTLGEAEIVSNSAAKLPRTK